MSMRTRTDPRGKVTAMTIQEIEAIMGAFEKHALAEFSYANSRESIRLKKSEGNKPVVIPQSAPAPRANAPAHEGTPLKAPLAGVFYRAAQPGDAPYVEVGTQVKKGQTVGLIEAMKMMSEIPAPCDGTVASFAAKNGDFVEYGQPLIIIKE